MYFIVSVKQSRTETVVTPVCCEGYIEEDEKCISSNCLFIGYYFSATNNLQIMKKLFELKRQNAVHKMLHKAIIPRNTFYALK